MLVRADECQHTLNHFRPTTSIIDGIHQAIRWPTTPSQCYLENRQLHQKRKTSLQSEVLPVFVQGVPHHVQPKSPDFFRPILNEPTKIRHRQENRGVSGPQGSSTPPFVESQPNGSQSANGKGKGAPRKVPASFGKTKGRIWCVAVFRSCFHQEMGHGSWQK